jgi:hypothetical protein
VVVKTDNEDPFVIQFERQFEKSQEPTDKSGRALTTKTPISIENLAKVEKPFNKISPKFSKSFIQRKSLESKRGRPYRSIINTNCNLGTTVPSRTFQNEKFFKTFEKTNKRKTSKQKPFNINSETQVAFQSNPLSNASKDKRCFDPDSSFC